MPSDLKSIEEGCFKSSLLSSISTTNQAVKKDLIIKALAFSDLYFTIQGDNFSLPNNTYKIYEKAFQNSPIESTITFPKRTRYINLGDMTIDNIILYGSIFDSYLIKKANACTYEIYPTLNRNDIYYNLRLINNADNSLPMIIDFNLYVGMGAQQFFRYQYDEDYARGQGYKDMNDETVKSLHVLKEKKSPLPNEAYLLFYYIPTKNSEYKSKITEGKQTKDGIWVPIEKIYEFVEIGKYVKKWVWNAQTERYEEINKEI